MRKCEECIWFELCRDRGIVCDDFYPENQEVAEEDDELAYWYDVIERCDLAQKDQDEQQQ